jgi:lipoic acid synthetase
MPKQLPPWLHPRHRKGPALARMAPVLRRCGVATICEAARCPNVGECFAASTATFLILGTECTRRCTYCAVGHGAPRPPDAEEPSRIAAAARELGLDYVVITSVTRDDLADGGASQFAATVGALRQVLPSARIETLVPDFGGDPAAMARVFEARPDILGHNVETVPRLYSEVRPGADYRRSLDLLRAAAGVGLRTKSGAMLGLGEELDEVREMMRDIASAGVSILTLGQYLQPTRRHRAVARYIEPQEFAALESEATALGFDEVKAGPFVRSSYRAGR